jgi:hypothetical protein
MMYLYVAAEDNDSQGSIWQSDVLPDIDQVDAVFDGRLLIFKFNGERFEQIDPRNDIGTDNWKEISFQRK